METEINLKQLTSRPISTQGSINGWKTIPIQDNLEKLVPVSIFTYPIYMNISNGYDSILVREGLSDRLMASELLLPYGMHLILFDGYRPYSIQKYLFDNYSNKLSKLHTDWELNEVYSETEKYVSLPSKDLTCPSPHSTGGSVDIGIYTVSDDIQEKIDIIDDKIKSSNEIDKKTILIDKFNLIANNIQLLDFGTKIDEVNERTSLDYYEKQLLVRSLNEDEQKCLKNRRLLYQIMTQSVGMEPYMDEWWHYNSPLTQMGASSAGKNMANYGFASTSNDLNKFNLVVSNTNLTEYVTTIEPIKD